MTELENAGPNSFVLLQVGQRRFALPADNVAELAPPVRLHQFPHTSPLVAGVIVRRGHIVPVYDAGVVLAGTVPSVHRFYLIARRDFERTSELSAIPVNGECELATGELQSRLPEQPSYVSGKLAIGEELLDVLDFEKLVTFHGAEGNEFLGVEAHP
jgi:chemotaxis signal transduction protein